MQYETIRAPRETATAGRLTYRQGDVGSWEPDQGSFDAVVTTRTLHHVPDPAAALGRMRRWLRPGGGLVALLSRERLEHRPADVLDRRNHRERRVLDELLADLLEGQRPGHLGEEV
jgi:ubiquinone/menaquinone biosynthesis C-methylase UbiE